MAEPTTSPQGPSTPQTAEKVDEAAGDWIRNTTAPLIKGVGDIATSAAKGVGEAAQHPGDTAGNIGKSISDTFSHLTFGSILGMIGGGIGAWLLSGVFGGNGFMSTILTVGLVPIFAFFGAQIGRNTIDPMLHGGQATGAPQPTAAPGQTPQLAIQPHQPAFGQQLADAGAFPTRYPFSNVCSVQYGGCYPAPSMSASYRSYEGNRQVGWTYRQ